MPSKTKQRKIAFYTCTYVPLEIIWAAGFIPKRLIGRTDICLHTDPHLWRNVCPYVHSVLRSWREYKSEGFIQPDLQHSPIIITNSCDAMRKLYDILKLESENVHLLDVPRESTELAIRFFSNQIRSLYSSLVSPGKKNNKSQIYSAIRIYNQMRILMEEIRSFVGKKIKYAEFFELKQKAYQSQPQIALEELTTYLRNIKDKNNENIQKLNRPLLPVVVTGSPIPGKDFISAIEEAGFTISINDSCLDFRWDVSKREASNLATDPFISLAQLYLNKVPCARMASRQQEIERLSKIVKETAEGIIHLRMPFCDLYGFDLVHFLKLLDKNRILHIDTDGSKQSLGQIKTRLQAFAEIILQKNRSLKKTSQTMKKDEGYYCGIDIGSSTVDGVILSSSAKILAYGIENTGSHPGHTALNLYKKMLKEADISETNVSSITTTGYGRTVFPFSHESISEISCHAYGIRYLTPNVSLVIDIGGQDSKVIKIDKSGKVSDFHMNDKCAAGTGRFLEVMAQALEMDIEEMSKINPTKGKKVPISSVCTVFAESEVVSLLGQGYPTPDIVRGLYQAITNRIEGLVRSVGLAQPIAITGGGALNHALVASIEKQLGLLAFVPDQPQLVGAIGAAILALEKKKQK